MEAGKMKRELHGKSVISKNCNMNRRQDETSAIWKDATGKRSTRENNQRENSVTWKNYHSLKCLMYAWQFFDLKIG